MTDPEPNAFPAQARLRWPEAETVIHFNDGRQVRVPHGDTLMVREGWVSVTDRVMRPDHPLSAAGQGRVERTRTWPAAAVTLIESIREELN